MIAPANRNKQATLLPERANPSDLREPSLGPPSVGGGREKILRALADERAGICPNILDAVLVEPALHFGESMPVFLRMLILVTKPSLMPRRLAFPIVQHWIERYPSVPRQSGDNPAQAERDARECVVKPKHDHPARSRKFHDSSERRARVGCVVQDARRVHHIE